MYRFGSFSNNGLQTGIIYGFFKQILSFSKIFNTSKMIFCWDSPVSVRKKEYPIYKEGRHKFLKPEDEKQYYSMLKQKDLLQKYILQEIGFRNNFCVEGFEADDIIAYFVDKIKAIFISSDNDLYQLLDRAEMYHLSRKKFFRQEDFEKEYNIKPNQWALAKAIGGCAGDNIKGVEGFSDPKVKTSKALKLIRKEITSGKLYDRFIEKDNCGEIKKFYSLVKIPHEKFQKTLIVRRNKVEEKNLIKVFLRYNFRSFLEENFDQWRYFIRS
jgi:5'-3' exonuclease